MRPYLPLTLFGLALLVIAPLFALRPEAVFAQTVHLVEEGETLASIAQLYYGDPKKGRVLRGENSALFEETEGLLPGVRIQIPHIVFHTVNEGESWAGLASRYYGTSARAEALRQLNRGEIDGPRPGE